MRLKTATSVSATSLLGAGAVVAILAFSLCELQAQESASRDRNSKSSKLAPVVHVEPDGTIVLKADDVERAVILIGVEWPTDEDAADAAHDFLEHLLLGESVIVDESSDSNPASKPTTEDSHTEKPVYLKRAPDRLFVNLELVRLGYTRVLAKPSFAQLAEFRDAEKKARDAGKGVWAGSGEGRARETHRSRTAKTSNPSETKPREEKPREAGGKVSGENPAGSVYVTPSGKKYHRSDCRFAANGRSILLQDAIQKGYTPCSRCKPPSR